LIAHPANTFLQNNQAAHMSLIADDEADGAQLVLAEHFKLHEQDQEEFVSVPRDPASAAALIVPLDSIPNGELQACSISISDSAASPSESLHTVVSYNASFATSKERMEFALKVRFLIISFRKMT
jgi:hypothetical protein